MSRRLRLLFAAVAGLLVATLVFVVMYAATPDSDLHRGVGEVEWERFQFAAAQESFTAGSVARLVNRDAVPVEFHWQGPDGSSGSFLLASGGMANLSLVERGTYLVTASSHPWGEVELEVRSANPLARLAEDLRDFEPRTRRSR